MRHLIRAVAVTAVAMAWPPPAGAAPAGFSEPLAIAVGGDEATAALNDHGSAVVAWLHGWSPAKVVAATRPTAGMAWSAPVDLGVAPFAYTPSTAGTSDGLQAVVTPHGRVVVAWIAGDRDGGVLHTVIGSTDGRFGPVHRRTLGPRPAARLVALRSGTVLLVTRTRGGLVRVAALRPGGDDFGSARSIVAAVKSFDVAAAGAGATIAWTRARHRSGRRYAVRAVRLDADGQKRGPSALVAGRAEFDVRVGGAPDGRAIVAWHRPLSGPTLTRMVHPSVGPARAFGVGRPATLGLPRMTFGPDGRVLAAGAMGFFPDLAAWTAMSRDGGPWRGFQQLGQLSVERSSGPVPASLADGTAVVAWQGNTVVVASGQRPPLHVEPLDDIGDLAMPSTPRRALVAWVGDGGHLLVAERLASP